MRGNVAFLCYEDKAKVPVVELNAPVSTGVNRKDDHQRRIFRQPPRTLRNACNIDIYFVCSLLLPIQSNMQLSEAGIKEENNIRQNDGC